MTKFKLDLGESQSETGEQQSADPSKQNLETVNAESEAVQEAAEAAQPAEAETATQPSQETEKPEEQGFEKGIEALTSKRDQLIAEKRKVQSKLDELATAHDKLKSDYKALQESHEQTLINSELKSVMQIVRPKDDGTQGVTSYFEHLISQHLKVEQSENGYGVTISNPQSGDPLSKEVLAKHIRDTHKSMVLADVAVNGGGLVGGKVDAPKSASNKTPNFGLRG